MNPEQMRIAIAEHVGWRAELWSSGGWQCYTPNNERVSDGGYGTKTAALLQCSPDFCSDLNAMHEAEKVLYPYGRSLWEKYTDNLIVTCKTSEQRPISATATQRAEAFLRAIGKWTDERKPTT